MQAVLKKTKVKLNLITDINMLLMVEKKRIRGGMCYAIHQYAIAIDRCMKGYD